MKWDEARGHVDAFWRRNQHSRYQIIYINIPSGSFLGTNSSITWGPLTTYMHPNDPQPQKQTLNPSASRKKKARRFLEIFETSEKILKPALNNVKFSHPRRWILNRFMHSELYVGWMLKPITFYTWPGLLPKSATPIEIMLAVFLIRSDQVTVAKSSDFEGFLLFVWSSLG